MLSDRKASGLNRFALKHFSTHLWGKIEDLSYFNWWTRFVLKHSKRLFLQLPPVNLDLREENIGFTEVVI